LPAQTETFVEQKPWISALLAWIKALVVGLWGKAKAFAAAVNQYAIGLSTTSKVLWGIGGLAGAFALQMTGALQALEIVPTVIKFVGTVGKIAINLVTGLASGVCTGIQYGLPAVIALASLYLLFLALKKK
jgi:hypothetical protein